jgi:hypothetical protein
MSHLAIHHPGRNILMHRIVLTIASLATGVGVVACGASAGSAPTAPPSPSGGARPAAGNVAFGQLVQINGQMLILSNSNGDATVTYAPTTTITQTGTGTLADITAGTCLTASGAKNATGTLTAASVTLSAPAKGSCTATGFGRGGGGSFSPRPSFSPPAQAAGFTVARGQVKTVSGTSVTLTQANGVTTTIDVPTTVKVSMATIVTPSALQTGQCLTAIGTKASSGAVAARALTITPPGANGCTAGFGGGFGRGGGFGGGFGGGGGAGSIGA